MNLAMFLNCRYRDVFWLSLWQTRQNDIESSEVTSSKSYSPSSTAVTTSLIDVPIGVSNLVFKVKRFEYQPVDLNGDRFSTLLTCRPWALRSILVFGSPRFHFSVPGLLLVCILFSWRWVNNSAFCVKSSFDADCCSGYHWQSVQHIDLFMPSTTSSFHTYFV